MIESQIDERNLFSRMKHRVFWARFFLAAAILTAAMIFWFSAQKGESSQQMSDGITLKVAQFLDPDFASLPEVTQLSRLETLSFVIRKGAHFCEYALLGFCLLGWLRFSRPEKRWRACQLPAWAIATLYAGTDELHQMFIDERSAQIMDVGVDSAGSLAGVLVATLTLVLILRSAGSRPSAT